MDVARHAQRAVSHEVSNNIRWAAADVCKGRAGGPAGFGCGVSSAMLQLCSGQDLHAAGESGIDVCAA
jgi:hypothetical protein